MRLSISGSLVQGGTWTATAVPSCEPILYGGMDRSGRLRYIPPQIKANEPKNTIRASLTTVSKGFFVGDAGGVVEAEGWSYMDGRWVETKNWVVPAAAC
jgi:hypothetical protein